MEIRSMLRNLVVGADTQITLDNGKNTTAINFDNAATTPPFHSVMKKIANFAPWYASIHRGTGYKSVISSDIYEEGREVIKRFVHADDTCDIVIYTKNTTEAINLLSYKLYQQNSGQTILTTGMEHLANDLPWRDKFKVDYVTTDGGGKLSVEDLENKLIKYKGNVKLVTVTGASNVTGYINPIYTIARLSHYYGAKILVDGAQMVPHVAMDMQSYSSPEHIDYLAFSAHKMYAPFGLGVLIGPKETFLQGAPVYQGGGAVDLVTRDFVDWTLPPAKDEAGTPNIMGVVALIAAIKTLNSIGMNEIRKYEYDLIRYVVAGLRQIHGVKIYCCSEQDEERVSLISFNMEGIHHELLAQMLSREAGIAVRSGLFCAHPYVEKLLHLSKNDLAYYRQHPEVPFPGMVRMSLGLYNNYDEVDIFLNLLDKIAENKNYYAY